MRPGSRKRSRPDGQGDFDDAPLLEGVEPGHRVPPFFPVLVVNEVDVVAGRNAPADPGAPTQLVGDIVVLDVIHEPEVGGDVKVGLELVNVLGEIPLGKAAVDKVGVDG